MMVSRTRLRSLFHACLLAALSLSTFLPAAAGDGDLPTEVSPDAPFRLLNGADATLLTNSIFTSLIHDVDPRAGCVGETVFTGTVSAPGVSSGTVQAFATNLTTGETFFLGLIEIEDEFGQGSVVGFEPGLFESFYVGDGVRSNSVFVTVGGVEVVGPAEVRIGETIQLGAEAIPAGGEVVFEALGGTGSVELDPETGEVTGRLPGTVRIGATYTVAGISCDDPTPLEITVPEPETLEEQVEVLVNELLEQTEGFHSEGLIENDGLVRSIAHRADVIVVLVSENRIEPAKRMSFSLGQFIDAQAGKGIDITAAGILAGIADDLFQRFAREILLDGLPMVIRFEQRDVVQATFPGGEPQEVAFSGDMDFVLWRSGETTAGATLIEFRSQSETALDIPGVGLKTLELIHRAEDLSFGTLDAVTGTFEWTLNINVFIDDFPFGIPVSLDVVDQVIVEGNQRTICLEGRAGGRIDESVPFFGGADFSFFPGSGCNQRSEGPPEDPVLEKLETVVDALKSYIDASDLPEADKDRFKGVLDDILRLARLGRNPDTILEILDEIGLMLQEIPNQDNVTIALGRLIETVESDLEIEVPALVKARLADIAAAIVGAFPGEEGKVQAEEMGDRIRDFVEAARRASRR